MAQFSGNEALFSTKLFYIFENFFTPGPNFCLSRWATVGLRIPAWSFKGFTLFNEVMNVATLCLIEAHHPPIKLVLRYLCI